MFAQPSVWTTGHWNFSWWDLRQCFLYCYKGVCKISFHTRAAHVNSKNPWEWGNIVCCHEIYVISQTLPRDRCKVTSSFTNSERTNLKKKSHVWQIFTTVWTQHISLRSHDDFISHCCEHVVYNFTYFFFTFITFPESRSWNFLFSPSGQNLAASGTVVFTCRESHVKTKSHFFLAEISRNSKMTSFVEYIKLNTIFKRKAHVLFSKSSDTQMHKLRFWRESDVKATWEMLDAIS